jgi:hypothetical protein
MKCPHCGFVFDRNYIRRRERFLAKRVDEIEWGKNVGKRILDACATATSYRNGKEVSSPIITVADLVQHTECSFRGIASVSHKRIQQVLAEYDLRLATLEEWHARHGEVNVSDLEAA